jgi:putative RNA 2'-phosphotransferase
LEKRNRQYVHLSERIDQAKDVGRRHGKLVLYRIDAEKMYQEGYVFYRSTSGVWLTDAVPFEYMEDIQVK